MEHEDGAEAPQAGISSRSRALAELRRLDWTRELDSDTLAAFEACSEFVAYDAGNVVVEFEVELTHIYFVVTGRLTAELFDSLGKKVRVTAFGVALVVGLFGIALLDRSHMNVVAAEPTAVFRLTLPALLELSAKHADFHLAVLRLGSNLVKQVVMVDRSLPQPAVVGVVHHSDSSPTV